MSRGFIAHPARSHLGLRSSDGTRVAETNRGSGLVNRSDHLDLDRDAIHHGREESLGSRTLAQVDLHAVTGVEQ